MLPSQFLSFREMALSLIGLRHPPSNAFFVFPGLSLFYFHALKMKFRKDKTIKLMTIHVNKKSRLLLFENLNSFLVGNPMQRR